MTMFKLFEGSVEVLQHLMRFEVLTSVKTSMSVFWVVTLRVLVGRYHHLYFTICMFDRVGTKMKGWYHAFLELNLLFIT
jgi:hypothetical protein